MNSKHNDSALWLYLTAPAATLALAAALAKGWEPGIRGEWVWEQGRLLAYFAPAMAAALPLAAAAWFLCRTGRWVGMRPASRARMFGTRREGACACPFQQRTSRPGDRGVRGPP